jgi:hypothetical protein
MQSVIAADRYRADVKQPSRWVAFPLGAVAFVAGVISQNVFTYGKRRATITDRTPDKVVGRFTEHAIVGEKGSFGLMLTDMHTRTAAEFERTWLAGDDNELTAVGR